jgi:purine-binding chemotaxis protein CheW
MAKEALQADLDESIADADGEGIEQDQYLVFTAVGQEYGIQAMRVREISAMIEITKVPKAPPYIEGILNLRGKLVSIINFRKKFGFDAKGLDEDTRIIIVEHMGFPIGIMVDKVEEVIRIPDENVQMLPETTTTAASADYLAGVGMMDNRLVILLDADQLLSKTDLLDVEAIRRVAGEALAQRLPEPAMGEKVDRGGQDRREPEPRKKEGR